MGRMSDDEEALPPKTILGGPIPVAENLDTAPELSDDEEALPCPPNTIASGPIPPVAKKPAAAPESSDEEVLSVPLELTIWTKKGKIPDVITKKASQTATQRKKAPPCNFEEGICYITQEG